MESALEEQAMHLVLPEQRAGGHVALADAHEAALDAHEDAQVVGSLELRRGRTRID